MGIAGLSNAAPGSVNINELTTVAGAWALAQFTDSTGQTIGAPSTNATGLDNAASLAQADLADIANGRPRRLLDDLRNKHGKLREFAAGQLRRPRAHRYLCQHPVGVRGDWQSVVKRLQHAAGRHRQWRDDAASRALFSCPSRRHHKYQCLVRPPERQTAVHPPADQRPRRLGTRPQLHSQRCQFQQPRPPWPSTPRATPGCADGRQQRDRADLQAALGSATATIRPGSNFNTPRKA